MQFRKNIKCKCTIEGFLYAQGLLNKVLVKKDVAILEEAMDSVNEVVINERFLGFNKKTLRKFFKDVELMREFFDEAQARGLIYDV